MYECLEPRSDHYAEIVLHNKCFNNDVELVSRNQLKQLLAEAYKQGYKDVKDLNCWDNECDQRILFIPHECMIEETAKELKDILAKTRKESVKYVAIQKDLQEIIRQVNEQRLPEDLPNLLSKEEFRNRLNHKE